MAKKFGDVLKENLTPAIVAVFGGAIVTNFAGTWIAKVPMADTALMGATVGGGIAALAALMIVDYFRNR